VVQESQAKGTIAQIMLFGTFDQAQFNDIQAHRVIDYILARYGSYANVVWCLHATPTPESAADIPRVWSAMRGVIRMDDAYFVQTSAYRVLSNECSASGTNTATF
jgi:hypothetical protein